MRDSSSSFLEVFFFSAFFIFFHFSSFDTDKQKQLLSFSLVFLLQREKQRATAEEKETESAHFGTGIETEVVDDNCKEEESKRKKGHRG